MDARKILRFAYLSGPVDALKVYEAWAKGEPLEYFGTSYLKQFYQTCADFEAEGYVVTTLPEDYNCQDIGSFVLENRPTPTSQGIRYHLAYSFWIIKIVAALIRFRPKVLLITAGHNYWIFLSVLKLFGVVIIPAIHDSLWKRFAPLKLSSRFLLRVEALFFFCCVDEVIVAAESTAEQVRTLVPRKNINIEVFLPTYPRQQFASVRTADFGVRPFNIFFMGRIETNKGIYDLVEVASFFNRPHEFQFHICGEGSELDSLRRRIEQRGLSALLTCYGFLDRKELYALLDRSHVVIVPTTTDFEEGFNMVCAEAILCGRPVITSAVCPALVYIKDAALEVPPNDIDGYRQAITTLSASRDLYEQKRAACERLQGQFYETNNSWAAKLRKVLKNYVAAPV
jgi:glycogen synthase